jgi:hypothetical protein
MKTKFLVIALTASLLGIGSCKQNDPTPSAGEPVVNEPGEPTGAAVSASIGPQGGSLTSADGTVSLQVPAGALDAATTISIQPITNNAPLGVAGGAYRFSPDGQRFKVPAKLTFRYTDQMLGGSSPELFWILTQAADGSWKALLKSSVNAANRTVSGEIKHFSDWVVGKFMDLTLAPESSTLEPGASVQLGVTGFKSSSADAADEEDDLAPLVSEEILELAPIGDYLAPIVDPSEKTTTINVKQWRLGGEGQLQGNGLTAKYTAPGRVPSRNPVAVSLELEYGKSTPRQKLLLVSNIRIVEKGVFTFTLDGKTYKAYQLGTFVPKDGNFPPGAGTIGYCGLRDISTQFERLVLIATVPDGELAISFPRVVKGKNASRLGSSVGETGPDVQFRFRESNTLYGVNYLVRQKTNGSCLWSGDGYGSDIFTLTLEQFEKRKGSAISGSFSGIIYEDTKAQANCTTSSKHSIAGEFNLALEDIE